MHAITLSHNTERTSYTTQGNRKRQAEAGAYGGGGKRHNTVAFAAGRTTEAMDEDAYPAAAAAVTFHTPAKGSNQNLGTRKPPPPKLRDSILNCPAYCDNPEAPSLKNNDTLEKAIADWGLCRKCRVTRAHKASDCEKSGTPKTRTCLEWLPYVNRELHNPVNCVLPPKTQGTFRRPSHTGGAGPSTSN